MGVSRREQMLQAAYEIVGSHGIEGLHARSVAAAVGVNHAAVHYYFPKRADLILALVEHAFNRFTADRDALLKRAQTPKERVDAHLTQAKHYSEPGHAFPRNWASFFIVALQDDAVRTELVRHFREWAVLLRIDLEGLSTDPELLVATLLGTMLLSQCVGPEFQAEDKLSRLTLK